MSRHAWLFARLSLQFYIQDTFLRCVAHICFSSCVLRTPMTALHSSFHVLHPALCFVFDINLSQEAHTGKDLKLPGHKQVALGCIPADCLLRLIRVTAGAKGNFCSKVQDNNAAIHHVSCDGTSHWSSGGPSVAVGINPSPNFSTTKP